MVNDKLDDQLIMFIKAMFGGQLMNKLCLTKSSLWVCKMTKNVYWDIIITINKGIIGKSYKKLPKRYSK